jgi:hypothetical protein
MIFIQGANVCGTIVAESAYRDDHSKHYCPNFGKPRVCIDSRVTAATNPPKMGYLLEAKSISLKTCKSNLKQRGKCWVNVERKPKQAG